MPLTSHGHSSSLTSTSPCAPPISFLHMVAALPHSRCPTYSGTAILFGPVRAALNQACQMAKAATEASWESRQSWYIPTSGFIPDPLHEDNVRALGLLCAVLLYHFQIPPSFLHPFFFKSVIDGVESIVDWEFLADHPAFAFSTNIIRKWPEHASQDLPDDYTAFVIAEYFGVRFFAFLHPHL